MYSYLLFTYRCYYPDGGWGDFKGCFDSVESALTSTPEDTDDDFADVVRIRTDAMTDTPEPERLYHGLIRELPHRSGAA